MDEKQARRASAHAEGCMREIVELRRILLDCHEIEGFALTEGAVRHMREVLSWLRAQERRE